MPHAADAEAHQAARLSAALGQAALIGLTIGIVLGEPLNAAYGGIFGFCFLSAVAMVYVKRHASLPSDTLVGVFLSMSHGRFFSAAATSQLSRGSI